MNLVRTMQAKPTDASTDDLANGQGRNGASGEKTYRRHMLREHKPRSRFLAAKRS
eukprot:SAG31_NODE_2116_length_6414_cov_2.444181_6_plen_55_part_00